MRKTTIQVLIGGISVFALLNMMHFILKTTSISRITCKSFDQAVIQNCQNLISIGFSLVAILILLSYYKKEIQQRKE